MSFSGSFTGTLLRYTQRMFTQVCFPHKFALQRRQAGKTSIGRVMLSALISHIDPAGFRWCVGPAVAAPHVCVLVLNTFAQLPSGRDSSPSSTSCFTCLFFRAR
uniref:(northern house mosquito) hypothetical protein n=1 Tax=Culex pipiens TaxID=7175 RepID=A0A8D8GBR0_CULPI